MKTDNELIAEFMNHPWKTMTKWIDNEDKPHIGKIEVPCDGDDLEYDVSWDWLMPVVEKIRRGNYGKEAFGSVLVAMDVSGFQGKWSCSILGSLTYQTSTYDGKGKYDEFTKVEIPSMTVYNEDYKTNLLECTHKAVVEFIKWYNDSKELTN